MNVLPVLLYWLRILVLRLKRHVKDQILPRKVRKVRGTSCRGWSIFLVHQRSLPLTKWAELNGRSHANLWRKGLLDRGKRKNKNELRAYLVCSEFTEGAVCQSFSAWGEARPELKSYRWRVGVILGLGNHSQDFRFSSEINEKLLEGFQQKSNMTWFII